MGSCPPPLPNKTMAALGFFIGQDSLLAFSHYKQNFCYVVIPSLGCAERVCECVYNFFLSPRCAVHSFIM